MIPKFLAPLELFVCRSDRLTELTRVGCRPEEFSQRLMKSVTTFTDLVEDQLYPQGQCTLVPSPF